MKENFIIESRLKRNTLDNKTPNGNGETEAENPIAEKRYRTRSSAPLTTTENEAKPIPQKEKPFIDFKGKVEYSTELNDIAFMADTLL